jgi:hypothetical protein
MRRFKGECEHFRFNKCPIYTHDGASAKFSNNSQEMDNSAPVFLKIVLKTSHDMYNGTLKKSDNESEGNPELELR